MTILSSVLAGVINHIISLLHGDQKIPVIAVLKLHVSQVIVLQVQPLNFFLLAARELVNLNFPVPGLVDEAVSGDVDPQSPFLDHVPAVVVKGFVDGLADQVDLLPSVIRNSRFSQLLVLFSRSLISI